MMQKFSFEAYKELTKRGVGGTECFGMWLILLSNDLFKVGVDRFVGWRKQAFGQVDENGHDGLMMCFCVYAKKKYIIGLSCLSFISPHIRSLQSIKRIWIAGYPWILNQVVPIYPGYSSLPSYKYLCLYRSTDHGIDSCIHLPFFWGKKICLQKRMLHTSSLSRADICLCIPEMRKNIASALYKKKRRLLTALEIIVGLNHGDI